MHLFRLTAERMRNQQGGMAMSKELQHHAKKNQEFHLLEWMIVATCLVIMVAIAAPKFFPF